MNSETRTAHRKAYIVYKSMLIVHELDAIVGISVSRAYEGTEHRHQMSGRMVEVLSQDVDGNMNDHLLIAMSCNNYY